MRITWNNGDEGALISSESEGTIWEGTMRERGR